MPTYDYACKQCGHRFEAFQSMKDPLLTTCPACEADALQRMIGGGAGLLFKGSGFYLTDYKKSTSSPTGSEAPPADSNADGNADAKTSKEAQPGAESKSDGPAGSTETAAA
ncbi:MAG: zinc ribbon domain-containing protein [Bacteroidetes bacterium]|nr:zinc ribbon domain-containing protein [Bacteroidota bacterium]